MLGRLLLFSPDVLMLSWVSSMAWVSSCVDAAAGVCFGLVGLNLFYSSQDMIKDRGERKAMFSPLLLQLGLVLVFPFAHIVISCSILQTLTLKKSLPNNVVFDVITLMLCSVLSLHLDFTASYRLSR